MQATQAAIASQTTGQTDVAAQAPPKKTYVSPFTERYVRELRTKTEKGDKAPLLRWMDRFEKGYMNCFLETEPKVAIHFYQLMIEHIPPSAEEREKDKGQAVARKVCLQFQRAGCYMKAALLQDVVIHCSDSTDERDVVPINQALFSMFCPFFIGCFGLKTQECEKKQVEFDFSKCQVEFLKEYVLKGRERLTSQFQACSLHELLELVRLADFVRYPELLEDCLQKLHTRLDTISISTADELIKLIRTLGVLETITPQYRQLQLRAITRFYTIEKPSCFKTLENQGFIVDIRLLGLLSAKNCVGEVLRATVRGFRVGKEQDVKYIQALECIEESECAAIQEIVIDIFSNGKRKSHETLMSFLNDNGWAQKLAKFPHLKALHLPIAGSYAAPPSLDVQERALLDLIRFVRKLPQKIKVLSLQVTDKDASTLDLTSIDVTMNEATLDALTDAPALLIFRKFESLDTIHLIFSFKQFPHLEPEWNVVGPHLTALVRRLQSSSALQDYNVAVNSELNCDELVTISCNRREKKDKEGEEVPLTQAAATTATTAAASSSSSSSSSSVTDQEPITTHIPLLFNETVVQRIIEEAKNGDPVPFLRLLQLFIEKKVSLLIKEDPFAALAFSNGMIELVELKKVPREYAEEAAAIFNNSGIYNIYTKDALSSSKTTELVCRDGKVAIGNTAFSHISPYFKAFLHSTT
ncbi:MAG TPA: hypothetical protein VN457_02240, partial [Chlamydiales bacterium]|nr:hypothetical protein [Chlamydiales bacterium]